MLPSYDLNLMRAFVALYGERNVTRAAALMNISQPAMSGLLAKLRELFNDPLFVRDKRGIQPTEKSDQLFPQLQQALLALDNLVQAQTGFNPATANRKFELSVNDYFEFIVLPNLMQRLRQIAPGIQLITSPFSQTLSESGILNGQADIAFGRIVTPPDNIVVRPALEDGLQCLVALDHPCGKRRMQQKDYERYPHVQVRPHNNLRTGVFQQLGEKGLSRQIACTVSHFLAVPSLLIDSECIATLPTRVCQLLTKYYPVRQVAPPVALAPFPFHLAWHARHQKDAAHKWLRDIIVAICRDINNTR